MGARHSSACGPSDRRCDECLRSHPQPSNLRPQTLQALRATPQPLRARLRVLRPTLRPSRASHEPLPRQGWQPCAQGCRRRPRHFSRCAQPFDSCARSCRPSRSKASSLALRSFSLARKGAKLAHEGRRVAREVETVARNASRVAVEGGEVCARRSKSRRRGLGRRVGGYPAVFRNVPTGAWGSQLHGTARRAGSLRGPAIGRLVRDVQQYEPESGRHRFLRR